MDALLGRVRRGSPHQILPDVLGGVGKEGREQPGERHQALVEGPVNVELVLAEARRRFQDHASGACPIQADLRAPVYRVVAAHGGEEAFKQMVQLYEASDLHEEKDRIARAMGAARDPAVLEKVMAFAVSDAVR